VPAIWIHLSRKQGKAAMRGRTDKGSPGSRTRSVHGLPGECGLQLVGFVALAEAPVCSQGVSGRCLRKSEKPFRAAEGFSIAFKFADHG
jgi:hypothetical protein